MHSPNVISQSPNGYPKDTAVCTYSTPHAPRIQKSFVVGSQSALQLKRSYKYLNHDGKNTKSLSMATIGDIQKKEQPDNNYKTGITAKDSQIHVHIESPTPKPSTVQPFRRTHGPPPPSCVPLLDLRQFNEHDEDMKPIELVKFHHPFEMDTDRTDISWGTAQISPKTIREPSNEQQLMEENGQEEMTVDDEEEKMDSETKEELETMTPVKKNDAHLNFVESRVVSNERGREECCHPTQHQPSQDPQNDTSLGLLNEKALSKRIRFSARVLTQNGRDIHRELCGFYFLVDNSFTVYEFRQFGQRVSALPLIPRGVYRHLYGKRLGQIYEIRHIKKGATLYFDTASLMSLPESLKKRSIVGIRVSDVDDEAKSSIMKRDLKPSQYSQVDSYLHQSPTDDSKRQSKLLQTLQGMIRNRLRGRASQVLVGLGRYLKRQSIDGLVEKVLLHQGMRAYHISLTPEDFDQLWDLLVENYCYSPCVKNKRGAKEGVWLDKVVSSLIGEMNEERLSIVRKIFLKMDSNKTGYVMVNDLQKHFLPVCHPEVVSKKKTVEEVMQDLYGCLKPPIGTTGPRVDRGCVTYADFEHYCEGVSIESKSDNEFINTMTKCWTA